MKKLTGVRKSAKFKRHNWCWISHWIELFDYKTTLAFISYVNYSVFQRSVEAHNNFSLKVKYLYTHVNLCSLQLKHIPSWFKFWKNLKRANCFWFFSGRPTLEPDKKSTEIWIWIQKCFFYFENRLAHFMFRKSVCLLRANFRKMSVHLLIYMKLCMIVILSFL